MLREGSSKAGVQAVGGRNELITKGGMSNRVKRLIESHKTVVLIFG